MSTRERARDAGVVRQASNDCAANKFGRWLPDCNHSADDFIGEQRKNAVVTFVPVVPASRGRCLRRRSSTTRCFGLGPWTIHEEVFEDEPAVASLERGTASAAYDLGVWRRVCLAANKLVLGTAVWAVEAGSVLAFRDYNRSQRSKAVPLSERERQKRKCLDARRRSRQVRVVQHDAGATRSNDLARRCDEMTTAYRFANVSGRVHHALSAREARANPLTSSGLKSAHRTRTLKPDGAFPDTQSSEGCCAGRRAQAQPSTASAFKIVPIAYRRRLTHCQGIAPISANTDLLMLSVLDHIFPALTQWRPLVSCRDWCW